MSQIRIDHLEFLDEAKEAFSRNPKLETWKNIDESLIALRRGPDRDCIEIYELDRNIAFFAQMIAPCPRPSDLIQKFSNYMQIMLNANNHKGGWEKEHPEFLIRQLQRNVNKLNKEIQNEDRDLEAITMRCANVANYAMMIADNEGDIK